MTDVLKKFLFEQAPIRGECVHLDHTWQHALAHQNYPSAVRTLLGEMMAAAALLSANLKFDGSLILHIQGDGPVRLLVVECDAGLGLRATAKLSDAEIPDAAGVQELVNAHGQGRFVITLDPHEKLPGQLPYQGIVPLDGTRIATIIEHYMRHSEQLDTRLWLATDTTACRGMLLQKLPESAFSTDQEALFSWEEATLLADTLKHDELVQVDADTLIHRLFWEHTLRVFEPLLPHFHCRCSREKVASMLNGLGQQEIESALEEQGTLEIRCEFCGRAYVFDRIDCAQLFLENVASGPFESAPKQRH